MYLCIFQKNLIYNIQNNVKKPKQHFKYLQKNASNIKCDEINLGQSFQESSVHFIINVISIIRIYL